MEQVGFGHQWTLGLGDDHSLGSKRESLGLGRVWKPEIKSQAKVQVIEPRSRVLEYR